MGYTTNFSGKFNLDKPLTIAHLNYLKAFSETRRMKRNAFKLNESIDDTIRLAVGLPIGIDGEFYVSGEGFMGQNEDDSILDCNKPPSTQPCLWCQWIPTEDGTAIEWNGGEKFYDYIEWIEYIIANFLKPWGYKITGDVKWEGENNDDVGIISIKDNRIKIKNAKIIFE